jgi:hypothetical protein
LNTIMLEAYGGAVARVANDATAFGHRDAMFNLGILAISDDPTIDTEQTARARDGWQNILPYSTGGAYVNYLSEGEDVHSAYNDALPAPRGDQSAVRSRESIPLQSEHSA